MQFRGMYKNGQPTKVGLYVTTLPKQTDEKVDEHHSQENASTGLTAASHEVNLPFCNFTKYSLIIRLMQSNFSSLPPLVKKMHYQWTRKMFFY